VPSGTMVHATFAMSLAAMCKSLPKDIGLHFLNIKSSNICLSRNRAVAAAQEAEAEYLLFLDSDMSFPVDALSRLLSSMQAYQCAVVGANYVMRQSPFKSLVYALPNEVDKEITQVNGICEVAKLPTGLMLIDMKVFNKLKKPYFRFPYREESEGIEATMGGEDYYFCDAVRAQGGRIFMDTDLSLEVTHWGDMGVKWDDNEQGYSIVVTS
jgi:glycosyltransferase involved in cell wall biosynthesis